MLYPLEDRVVVLMDAARNKSEGGIVLPEAAREKPTRGKVVAVGPGRVLENGSRAPMDVKVDDVVIFPRYGGSDIEVGNVEYRVLPASEILVVVK